MPQNDYGRDIHYALKGVVENVGGKRWRAARSAVKRKWFAEREEEDGMGLWERRKLHARHRKS